jgi:thiosulfate/3-mercaptopyruvate sulfurtransferase
MKRKILRGLMALFAATVLTFFSFDRAQAKVRSSMIVSTDWLAQHLNDKSLVLLHVGDKKDYDAAHIPGAQYIQSTDISTRAQGLSLELLPIEQLKAAFEKFGVTDKSRIIIYFGKDWVTPTSRVYFTLDYLGLGDRASILDGGMPAWIAEKRPVTADVTAAKPGSFIPHPRTNLVVDAAWVRGNINKPGVAILDARDAKFYTGESAGNMPRAGHIPSARSIPFGSVVEESNKFKNEEALRQIFNHASVKASDSVATYCHIGQQASLLYFVARYLGYDAHLYDGSFQEWSNRKDLPVETSGGAGNETKPPQ